MNDIPRKSRLGFVVIKFRVNGFAYYLMRLDSKWKDLNFIGGHEKERDAGDLKTTARREFWEEVPSIRSIANYELHPLTSEFSYGPIHSRSKRDEVIYELQFFLLRLSSSPEAFVEGLGLRSKNWWVVEDDLINPGRIGVSGLVKVLDEKYSGGLQSIPFSSPLDLQHLRDRFAHKFGNQLELGFVQGLGRR